MHACLLDCLFILPIVHFCSPSVAPPKITTHPRKIIYINEGANLILNCSAIGYPLPSVSWLKDNASLLGTQLFPERGKGMRLHFTNITYERRGKYTCVARNSVGMASYDVKIIFKGKELLLDIQTWQSSIGSILQQAIFVQLCLNNQKKLSQAWWSNYLHKHFSDFTLTLRRTV